MQKLQDKLNSAPFLILILLAFFLQSTLTIRDTSITLDEPLHIASGYASLFTGDYRLVEEHPPLIKMLQAAPLLLAQPALADPRTLPGWEDSNLITIAQNQVVPYPSIDQLTFATRIPTLLIAMLLLVLIYRWTTDLFGPRAGLLALFLAAFDPNLLAHASVAATDLGATTGIFAALYLFQRWLKHPRGRRALAAGLVLGLALCIKSTALILLPVMGVLLIFARPHRTPLQPYIFQTLAALGIAFLTLWGIYRFEFGPVPGLPFPIPAPSHLLPLLKLQSHMQEGHSAFLLGENYFHGDWRYFPIAFALKTPPLTLAMLLGTALMLLLRRKLPAPGWRTELTVLIFPLIYFAISINSGINIGYRHLLPVLPFGFVWISRLAAVKGSALFRWSGSVLLVLYAGVTLSLCPWYLAYFNFLAGGPDGGYRYLVDSNLDWGQTWKALREYLTSNHIDKFHFSSYTIVDPHAYDLDYIPLPPWPEAPVVLPQRFDPEPGIYALSTTQLQGVVIADSEMFDYFRKLQPSERIGHALFIYDIPPHATTTWIAQCNIPGAPLPPDIIAEGFGRPDLRRLEFDCTAGWIYPAGNGWYVLNRATLQQTHPPALQTARLSFEQTRPGALAPFAIYESFNQQPLSGLLTPQVHAAPAEWPPAQIQQQGTPLTLPVQIGNDLDFLGYKTATLTFTPGQTVTVETYWRVRSRPTTSLSLMAHLLNSDGQPLAVGDGLSVPVDQWEPGDIIVQQHRFAVPAGTPAGPTWLRIGAYTLPDARRWPILAAEKAVGDILLIETGKVTAP